MFGHALALWKTVKLNSSALMLTHQSEKGVTELSTISTSASASSVSSLHRRRCLARPSGGVGARTHCEVLALSSVDACAHDIVELAPNTEALMICVCDEAAHTQTFTVSFVSVGEIHIAIASCYIYSPCCLSGNMSLSHPSRARGLGSRVKDSVLCASARSNDCATHV